MNQATLIGRIGKDPEIRFTNGGQAIANFSVATDESYKNRDGEKVKKTEWHRVVAWGKLAEVIQKYFVKGSLVVVGGKIQTREWEDKTGNKNRTTEIVANYARVLSGGKDGAASSEQSPEREPGDGTEETPETPWG